MNRLAIGVLLGIATGLAACHAIAQSTATGRVVNIEPTRASFFAIQEAAPGNRITVYAVSSNFRATINGTPVAGVKDIFLGDVCAISTVTPPLAVSAACKR